MLLARVPGVTRMPARCSKRWCRRAVWRQITYVGAVLIICPYLAWSALGTFVSGSRVRQKPSVDVSLRAKGTASEPWKPLVFKMPKKKPPRQLPPDDDGYSLRMRERLKALELKEESADKQRSVSDSKLDDLIAREADDAKINGLNAMYYMDRITDEVRAEEENPDKHVMRRNYEGALQRLDRSPASKSEASASTAEATPRRQGFVELGGGSEQVDPDDLFEAARSNNARKPLEVALPHKKAVGSVTDISHDGEAMQREDEVEDEEDIVEYLETLQKRSAKSDGISRRVVKSREDRRQEYEDSKGRILAATAAIGVLGSAGASVFYGVNAAFSFGLGSLAGLYYLSSLSAYTDNAENPLSIAMGGRRYLAPVILVLLVIQWYKIEALVPAVASLGLEPQLLPALLGFLMYSLGKVIGGSLK